MTTPSDGERWPLPVKDFLREAHLHLRRSDVVLCQGSSLFSRGIRWVTRSQFSHGALVFAVPNPEEGFANTFLIEAVPTGTDVTDLRHYAVDERRHYQLVIKRLNQPWFDGEAQKHVRGHMLDFIKADYDFRTVRRLFAQFLRVVLFGLRSRTRGFRDAAAAMARAQRHIPTHFICSGFVQYGFYAAVQNLIRRGKLPLSALDDVTFFPSKPGRVYSNETVISTTPEDLAHSAKLDFCFVITRGWVYRVSTDAEATHLLQLPAKRHPYRPYRPSSES